MTTWIDAWGEEWHQTTSVRRLKFKIPCHAALRKHVFFIDGYKCKKCNAKAKHVPENYTGRETLLTNTFTPTGYSDLLVIDHILTLKAGGENHVSNMQTLCETCNKKKIKQDLKDAAKHRSVNHGSR